MGFEGLILNKVPSILLPATNPSSCIMCRRLHVCHVYTRCGHPRQQPEQEVRCNSVNCKFSPFHPSTCQPPYCSQTCAQYRLFPEQYTRHIDDMCPDCHAATAAAASGYGRRRR